MRIAVYSVYYGNREPFNPECLHEAEGYDRFVVTDREYLKTDATIITEPLFALDPKRASLRAKLRPYRYFKEYDWTIYLDNKANLLKDPSVIINNLDYGSFFCFLLGGRDCIYEEAKICIKRGLEEPNIIRRQMKTYTYDKFPRHAGLIQSTLLIRRMDDPQWEKAGEHWFEQVLRHARRDQLSFNYVAWKLDLKPQYLPGNVHENDYIQWPILFKDEDFKHNFEFIPKNLRKRGKKVLGQLGILGFLRGRQHSL